LIPSDAVRSVWERARHDPSFRNSLTTFPRVALQGYDLTELEVREVILPNFSWVLDGRLAGCSAPRNEEAYALLKELGVEALLCLTNQVVPATILEKHRLHVTYIPIPDFSAPTIDQVEHAVSCIQGCLDSGNPIAVHCGAGIGRTGTILSCYFVHTGVPAIESIESVRKLRPKSIETPEQEALVLQYDTYLKGAR